MKTQEQQDIKQLRLHCSLIDADAIQKLRANFMAELVTLEGHLRKYSKYSEQFETVLYRKKQVEHRLKLIKEFIPTPENFIDAIFSILMEAYDADSSDIEVIKKEARRRALGQEHRIVVRSMPHQ